MSKTNKLSPIESRVTAGASPDIAKKIIDRMKDFGFSKIHPETSLNAEYLLASRVGSSVGDVFNPKKYTDLKKFLDDKGIHIDSQEAERFLARNSDIALIDEYTSSCFKEYTKSLSSSKNKIPPGSEIAQPMPLSNFDSLLDLVSVGSIENPNGHGVNLESLILVATAHYVELESLIESRGDPTKILQQVHAIESICAPFCEIVGFDALAMAARSLTGMIQTEASMSNTPEALSHTKLLAREVLDSMGNSIEIEKICDQMLSEFDIDVSLAMLPDTSEHGITYGIGTWEAKNLSMSDPTLRLIVRKKSLGSLMRRLYRILNSEEERSNAVPTDMLAMTFVVKNTDQVATMLESIAGHLLDTELPQFEGKPSPKRSQFIHATGDKEFQEDLKRSLPEGIVTLTDFKTSENGFEVAKLTFHYHDHVYNTLGELQDRVIPVEIQIQTEQARVISKIGKAGHWLLKLSHKVPEDDLSRYITRIQELHKRRRTMNDPSVTNQSLLRADETRKHIKRLSKGGHRLGIAALRRRAD